MSGGVVKVQPRKRKTNLYNSNRRDSIYKEAIILIWTIWGSGRQWGHQEIIMEEAVSPSQIWGYPGEAGTTTRTSVQSRSLEGIVSARAVTWIREIKQKIF